MATLKPSGPNVHPDQVGSPEGPEVLVDHAGDFDSLHSHDELFHVSAGSRQGAWDSHGQSGHPRFRQQQPVSGHHHALLMDGRTTGKVQKPYSLVPIRRHSSINRHTSFI